MDHSVCNMKAILAVAVLAMAAFAGVMIVGDDADAAEGDCTFKVGSTTYTINIPSDGKLPALADVAPSADATYFVGWIVTGTPGTTYAPGSNVPAGQTTFEAVFQTFEVSVFEMELVDSELKEKAVKEAALSKTVNAGEKFKLPARNEGSPVISGYQFIGWTVDGELLQPGTEITITKATKVVATYNDGFVVTFSADPISVSEKSLKVTEAGYTAYVPAKTGKTFTGWYDAAGKMAFDKEGKYKSDYTFTADVTLVAGFEPIYIEVTYMVDGEKYDVRPVAYGDFAPQLILPVGYESWCTLETVEGEDVLVDFDFKDDKNAIVEKITLYAKAAAPVETIYVTFNIEGTLYGPYEVNDRFSIPNTARDGFLFAGWIIVGGDGTKLSNAEVSNFEYTTDVTFQATYDVAPAPAGPGFFETTEGKCVAVLIAVVIIAFIYAVYSNMFGLKDALTSVKITRVKK